MYKPFFIPLPDFLYNFYPLFYNSFHSFTLILSSFLFPFHYCCLLIFEQMARNLDTCSMDKDCGVSLSFPIMLFTRFLPVSEKGKERLDNINAFRVITFPNKNGNGLISEYLPTFICQPMSKTTRAKPTQFSLTLSSFKLLWIWIKCIFQKAVNKM